MRGLRARLQGGAEPSWQTTVVPEPGGTTTVVFAGGGGGLLLLMHPESIAAATNKLQRTLIIGSFWGSADPFIDVTFSIEREGARQRPITHADVAGSPTVSAS